MDLRHFFEGQQSRENAASAFLATLLEHDRRFRAAFLEALAVPGLDPDASWSVRVEDARPWGGLIAGLEPSGSMDVTLESDDTVIVIEDKLVATAKTDGQLLRYHRQAAVRWADRRLVTVYLAPTLAIAASEVALVEDSDTFRRRVLSGDAVRPIAWTRIRELIEATPDAGWFMTSGIREVTRVIEESARGLPQDAQREALREIVRTAATRLDTLGTPVRFFFFPGSGEQDIMAMHSPVSIALAVRYATDPATGALLDVVSEAGVRVAVRTTIGLNARGRSLPAVRAAWRAVIAGGAVDLEGVGTLAVRAKEQVIEELPPDLRSPGELVDLLVGRGEAAVRLLRPCLEQVP